MPNHALEHLRIPANGQTFHVVACGPADAPPMMLLHGFPEGWMSWREVMLTLAGRWRVYAPDLRGYGTSDHPADGYDVLTLTDDIHGLMDALHLERPVLVGHDWGGALSWIFAHRFSARIRRLIVVNCTHPRTLERALAKGEDGQRQKSWYMAAFQLPWLPERVAVAFDGAALRRAFRSMEGRPGVMDPALINEVVATFKSPADMYGPISYYRAAARLPKAKRATLDAAFATPISVPITHIWGDADKALVMAVGQRSERDAGCPVDWRVLPGIGHFVSMEVPQLLAEEIDRATKIISRRAS